MALVEPELAREPVAQQEVDYASRPSGSGGPSGSPEPTWAQTIFRIILLMAALYLFFFSIKLMGHSFKLAGKDFAKTLIETTNNPYLGLMLGIVATSLIQSSSTTTSIVIAMVAAGTLTVSNAIPIIMGANIGTTITNTIVSLAHVTRKEEFERAFAGSIVHDCFNVLAVLVLFPIEINFHIIERIVERAEKVFAGVGATELLNPLDYIIKPLIKVADSGFEMLPVPHVFMMIVSLGLLFAALTGMVRMLRLLMIRRMESVLSGFLFGNPFASMAMGVALTVCVQSSSITTSLVIPLVGAGLLTITQIFPYVLGANIGTTMTAILAALATKNDVAITAAFAHLLFNIMGIAIWWPLKAVPIYMSLAIGRFVVKSKVHMAVSVTFYVALHFIPILLAWL